MATKTINLTGAEVAVTGLDGAHAHIRNDGTEVIYAAKTAGITVGADGVASIPAGQSDTIRGISGAVYLLGTGSVLIQSDDYVASPFKTSTASGGSAVDEQARTAINAHSGNAEIHVTADEKAKWNAKAELSDIPTTLPANGGNADTLGNIPASELERVRTAIMAGEAAGVQWTAMQAKKDDTMIRVQVDADYDRLLLYKSIDGGVTWTEIPLGNADTANGLVYHELGLGTYYTMTASDFSKPGIYGITSLASGSPNVLDEDGFNVGDFKVLALNNNPNYQMVIMTSPRYTDNRAYIGKFWDNNFIGWKRISDGGNAATLESHPASDFVLKTDYDALVARVAALEGGTT